MDAAKASKLEVALRSTLSWVEDRLASARDAGDIAFLNSVRRYCQATLRQLRTATSDRQLTRVHRRVEKLHTATLLYVQQGVSQRKI
jgi:hypothetical protein